MTSALLALLLMAVPALAEFEGVLEMKMSVGANAGQAGGAGTMNVAVGRAGIRSEVSMRTGAVEMKMVMLQKNDTPDVLYQINDGSKTYTEINLAGLTDLTGPQANAVKYSVQTLGQETMLGYKTRHVLVKEIVPGGGTGASTELWSAKDLLDYETFSKLQARRGKAAGQEALVKALKDAGADGLPLKSIATMPDGARITMEVVKVDKQPLPASTFQLPAGYTKSDAMPKGTLPSPTTAEAQQKMQEAMKKLSPEQRALVEKMLKQRQNQGQ
jgi:hypothetical protein